jgi:2'-5' RNA ligase
VAADPGDGRAPGAAVTIGISIPVPEPFGRRLRAARLSLGDPLAASIPAHITLAPPTVVPCAELPGVVDHLLRVATAERRFWIRLRGTGTFRPVSPVVFVALAEGIEGCERVQANVMTGPLHGAPTFPYHPHVTIAHHLPDEVMDRAFKELSGFRADFEAWGFALYKLGRDGIWRRDRDFTFGTGHD